MPHPDTLEYHTARMAGLNTQHNPNRIKLAQRARTLFSKTNRIHVFLQRFLLSSSNLMLLRGSNSWIRTANPEWDGPASGGSFSVPHEAGVLSNGFRCQRSQFQLSPSLLEKLALKISISNELKGVKAVLINFVLLIESLPLSAFNCSKLEKGKGGVTKEWLGTNYR